jgi:outer membrane protein assembly factor BamB
VTPGTAVVAQDGAGVRPLVIVQGADEELVAFQPPKGDGASVERWRLPGRGQSTNWPGEARGPVVVDLFGDGRRQFVYATAATDGCGRIVAADLDGRPVWNHDFPNIPGTPPIWNTGGIVIWQVGHFTDPRRNDVLVTVRRSIMHSEQVSLLSGEDGRELWRRAHEIDDRGVGGTPFAIADYDGDGLDDIASLYPSELYLLKGTTGHDLLAMQTSWEGVPAKPVYWGIPVAGDFEGNGQPALFFGTSNGSMTGLVRLDGTLVWWDALDKSPRSLPAVGDFDGDGHLEAIGVGYQEDGIRCYDAATGKIKWRLPMPASGDAAGTASADINSDGRDEALFTLGGTLYCVGTPQPGGAGALLWQLDLPATLGPPTIADADGDGLAEIILVGADGSVYGVR